MSLFFLDLLTDACDDVSVLKIILFIKTLIEYAFIIVPAGAILMLTIDMAKNVASSREDEQRKNLGLFLKRCIYLLIIFLVPSFVSLILSFFEEEIDTSEFSKCMNVTSESIKSLTSKAKSDCINNYEWDTVNDICVFVGEKGTLSDGFSVIERRQRLDVKTIVKNKNTDVADSGTGSVGDSGEDGTNGVTSNKNIKSNGLMKEYAQGNSKWANYSFCSYKRVGPSGCGATAYAMVVTGYGNNANATPKDVRDYICGNNLRDDGDNGGLKAKVISNTSMAANFGMNVEVLFSNSGSVNYSEKLAKKLKDAVDSGYGVMILVPGHYVAIDKRNCPNDKVYYYNPAEMNNGCMTMKELWNETWDRKDRCTHPENKPSCGWRWAWKFSPKN